MKIAILGGGPIALHTALKASNLGASVTLFAPHGPSERIAELARLWPSFKLGRWQDLSTQEGLDITKTNASADNLVSAQEYYDYLKALFVALMPGLSSFKPNRIKRVHKRFLDPNEVPLGATRFFDLFRVVYALTPETQMKELEIEHPEMAQNLKSSLSQNDWSALSLEAESFEDFDAVFEATGRYQNSRPAGPGASLALNESHVRNAGGIFYGTTALLEISKILQANQEKVKGEFVIVGSGELAAMGLAQLGAETTDDSTITLITTELDPFACLRASTHPIMEELENLLRRETEVFEKMASVFEDELHAWRALESHVRAKTPAPSAPKRRLRLWAGANITALDRLSDRDELFVTTELPAFRSEEKKEGEKLMTIACQNVFVFTGHESQSLYHPKNIEEVGHYQLDTFSSIEDSFNKLLQNFSRA